MKTAKAALFTGINQPFSIREYPIVPPSPGHARLHLIASGICGTDIHIHRGALISPERRIIGHEFVGVVDAIAQDDAKAAGLSPGDACIASIALPCGECALCRAGDDANCVNMGVTNGADPEQSPHFHGGYGEYTFSPIGNLVRIPPSINPVGAAVFACAGPTVLHALHLAERTNVPVKDAAVAVVQGLGPVGMFAVLKLRAMGIENIIAITSRTVPAREEQALALGATHCFGLDRHSIEDIAAAIQALNGGLGADLVIEASGNPEAFVQGLALLRNRGAYLVPGQYSASGTVALSPEMITFKALHIIGSSQYAMSDVRAYVTFLEKTPGAAEKMLKLASLYPLERVNQAFADMKSGKNIKTLLVL